MRRGSQIDFYKIIECLNETGQRHLSRILSEDGAVAHLVATSSPADNREQQERRVVDQLTMLLKELGTPWMNALLI